MAPAPADTGTHRAVWIAGVALLTAIVTLVVYVLLSYLLGPIGFIIAVLAWLGLLAVGALFTGTPHRRTTGIGLLTGAVAAAVVAVVLGVVSN